MNIGCIHGRFQPFHNEHLEYAQHALDRSEFLWIGITQYDIQALQHCDKSPNRSAITSNPLTYLERANIISDALEEAGTSKTKYNFIPFPIDAPEKLYQFVEKSTICYTTIRDAWNREKVSILKTLGYEVCVLWERLEEKEVSSTLIRQMLVNGDSTWRNMVPHSTIKHIEQLELGKRLRNFL